MAKQISTFFKLHILLTYFQWGSCLQILPHSLFNILWQSCSSHQSDWPFWSTTKAVMKILNSQVLPWNVWWGDWNRCIQRNNFWFFVISLILSYLFSHSQSLSSQTWWFPYFCRFISAKALFIKHENFGFKIVKG